MTAGCTPPAPSAEQSGAATATQKGATHLLGNSFVAGLELGDLSAKPSSAWGDLMFLLNSRAIYFRIIGKETGIGLGPRTGMKCFHLLAGQDQCIGKLGTYLGP